MTDKPMTMREKMALTIANTTNHNGAVWTPEEWADAVSAYNAGTDMQRRMMLGVSQPLSAVDALLDVMETPSEAVIQAGEDDGGHSVYRWTAMVKAIRGGA